jgi:hypothetical protein
VRKDLGVAGVKKVLANSVEGVYNMLSMFRFDFSQEIIAITHYPTIQSNSSPDESSKNSFSPAELQHILDATDKPEIQEYEEIRNLRATVARQSPIYWAIINQLKQDTSSPNEDDQLIKMAAGITLGAFTKKAIDFHRQPMSIDSCPCSLRFTLDTKRATFDYWDMSEHTISIQNTFLDIPPGKFQMEVPGQNGDLWDYGDHKVTHVKML